MVKINTIQKMLTIIGFVTISIMVMCGASGSTLTWGIMLALILIMTGYAFGGPLRRFLEPQDRFIEEYDR